MNNMQVVFTVNSLKRDYYFLKVDEIKYVFEKAKKGGYGTMYDRIDAAVIFEWIELYVDERMQMAIDENIEQNKMQNIGSPIHPDLVDKVVDVLKKSIEHIPAQKEIDKELRAPVRRERTPQEQLIQSFFVEFDMLHREKPHDPYESIRTIPFEDWDEGAQKIVVKNLTQPEYVQIRLLEQINNGKKETE